MPSPRISILKINNVRNYARANIFEGITQHDGASTRQNFSRSLCRAREDMRPSKGFGFTLIEILIALAIFGILLAVGVVVGIDSLSRYNFHAEIDNSVAMLQKARSESINNIGGVTHGVNFTDVSDIVLYSTSYSPPAHEFKLPKNPMAIYSGTTDINFAQLSGAASGPSGPCPCIVTITDGAKPPANITINHEGGIDY